MKRFIRTYLWRRRNFYLLTGIVILFAFYANARVKSVAKSFVFDDLDSVPHNRVGLLLGTSQYLKSGQTNLYYLYRIDAAEALYKAGKIEKILISGDNSRKDYNEPEDMKQSLMQRGIKEADIVLDYAGFRTYDSVIRAQKVFGQSSFTVISQRFHNERALYISHKLGLESIAFNAKDVTAYSGFKTQLREKLARV